jgi:lysophospholipid acyltransferase (LPLAT)-like uncharacterized protein
MRDRLRTAAIVHAGGVVSRAILATTRAEWVNEEPQERIRAAGKGVIFMLWHGRLLPCIYLHRHQGIVGIVSRNRDGEYLARLMHRWGFATARGSSSAGGGEALRALVRHLRAGRSVAITPDGPRGPREVMTPGVVTLARLSGAPIIPASAGASRGWWFGSWDRLLVPQPFARIRMVFGDPVEVPRDLPERETARVMEDLSRRLAAATAEADRW